MDDVDELLDRREDVERTPRDKNNRLRKEPGKKHGKKPKPTEHQIDKTLADSFPASDPPGTY